MRRSLLVVVASAGLLGGNASSALAQVPKQPPVAEQEPAAPEAAPVDEAPVEAAPVEATQAPAPLQLIPVAETDSPEVVALFERAIEAFVRADFAAAASAFEEVAKLSQVPERRWAAEELARQAARRVGTTPSAGLALDTPGDTPNKDTEKGRAAFLATTILMGLNYGWIVPVVLRVEDPKGFVGLYLLTAGGSFVAPYLLTRNDHITKSMSTLGGAGATFGMGHGVLAYLSIAGEDGVELRPLLASALAGSVIEGSVGYLWARDRQVSAEESVAIVTGSLWGTGLSAALGGVIGGEDPNFRGMFGGMLLGSAVGAYGGYLYDHERQPTDGGLSLTSYTGFLGVYGALVPILAADLDSTRTVSGSLLAGGVLGLVVGDRISANSNYSAAEGGVVALGSMAGGLLGAGAAFLVTPKSVDAPTWVVTGGAAGAIGGLYLMLQAVDGTGHRGQPDQGDAAMKLTPTFGEHGETGMALVGSF